MMMMMMMLLGGRGLRFARLALEEARERVEERRSELTVLPEGHPPVKPPLYFGGDVLGRGPWTQYWKALNSKAHHFRESVG